MFVQCIRFLLCITNYLKPLKITHSYYLIVSVGQDLTGPLLESHKTMVKVEIRLCSHMEFQLRKSLLLEHLRCWQNLFPCGCMTERSNF
jgi:hypothetical protein